MASMAPPRGNSQTNSTPSIPLGTSYTKWWGSGYLSVRVGVYVGVYTVHCGPVTYPVPLTVPLWSSDVPCSPDCSSVVQWPTLFPWFQCGQYPLFPWLFQCGPVTYPVPLTVPVWSSDCTLFPWLFHCSRVVQWPTLFPWLFPCGPVTYPVPLTVPAVVQWPTLFPWLFQCGPVTYPVPLTVPLWSSDVPCSPDCSSVVQWPTLFPWLFHCGPVIYPGLCENIHVVLGWENP